MKFSTRGRYALRLMVDLAKRDRETPVSLKDISEEQEISFKYLEQIVKSLTKVGILKSVRGAQGGYLLNRLPEQITAGDILRATEGTLLPVSCIGGAHEDCARLNKCEAYNFWNGLYYTLNEYVDSVTLQDLINGI